MVTDTRSVNSPAMIQLARDVHTLRHVTATALSMADVIRAALARSDATGPDAAGRHLAEFIECCEAVTVASRAVMMEMVDDGRPGPTKPPRSERLVQALLVENDRGHLVRYREIFGGLGWRVTAVSSAAKGLTQVKRKNFDAAILDLMMPPASFGVEAAAGGRRTGLVLAERIRAIRPEIPIAILTVADDADAKLWCRAHPPAVYLTKGNLALESVSSVQDLIRGSNQVATDDVERWIRRLPILLLHLGIRSRGRPSLAVRDEYDVQDAVRLLLALKYEDVRSEDSGPRVAGRGGRIDFLLPSSHIAVEVKVGLRPGAWKRIGDELLVDVARYRRHPDVSSLICVVVHDGSLDNPEGFASDIRATAASTLDVRVVVLNPFPVPGLRRPTNADRPVLKHRQSPVIGKRTGR